MTIFDAKSGPTYLHVCADGHHWTEQNDGTVSPSYGYGGTCLTWRGYDPRTCPEPASVDGHGYLCACGTRWFSGGCGCKRWRPPKAACKKPPVATFLWVSGTAASRKRGEAEGWIDVTERQLELGGSSRWEQPSDAIRELEAASA